jgi:TolB-like protein/DNA-binding winged helix-turn-helix (wHTH) protein/Tfp pilus assembly protein PilF
MNEQAKHFYAFGPFRLDPQQRVLLRDGRPIPLTPKAVEILLLLVEKAAHLVDKDDLMKRVWPDAFVEEGNLTKNVFVLRRALGNGDNGREYIETVAKRGYRFVARVTAVVSDSEDQAIETEPQPSALAAPPFDPNALAALPPVPAPVGTVPMFSARELRDRLNPVETALPITGMRQRFPARRLALASAGLMALLALLLGLDLSGLRERLLHRAAGPAHIESVAVLPLQNLSRDPEQEYFADGMTEELITDLSKIGALRVISRTSVMHYKGTQKTVPQIARELNVDAVVEGAVARSGNRVRITAQLIEASTDTHLWADNFERDLKDVLRLQDEVALEIASEIKVKVTPQEQTRLASARPVNPEAHELYLKGRYYWNKRTPKTLKKSLEYFQQAIEKDSSYAPAYAGVAASYAMLGAGAYQVLPAKEAYPKAEAAARRALELDSTLAEAHASLAWSKMVFDWDWQGAEREYKQAIQIDPGYANAHHWFALYLSEMGRHTEAIAEDRTAESLDPLSLIISADLGKEALGPAGLYDQEMEQCRKTLEMDPNFAEAHHCLADSYRNKRMYKEAVAEFQKAVNLSKDDLTYLALLGNAYGLAGERGEATKILNELKARSKHEYVSPDNFCDLYVALGDKDRAFAWLERAYEEHTDAISGLKLWRKYDPLRSDPRYQELLRRVGLPP